MLGLLDHVIRAATRRDVWDAPASWMTQDQDHRHFPDRKAIEEERARLRREMLVRSGR